MSPSGLISGDIQFVLRYSLVSVAAIAEGKFLYPSRTQKISLPTFLTVLRCESPWELWIAAMLTLPFYFNWNYFDNSTT